VWEPMLVDYPCFVRFLNDHFCRVYQIAEHLWRWEVHFGLIGERRLTLVRLGTGSSQSQAIAMAENYVQNAA
jgi:hypothetical protein